MKNYITKPIPEEKPDAKRVVRPWGSFSQYAFNEDVTVSLMSVKPGELLSLQSHTARAELWIVFDEGTLIQVGEEEREYSPGDEVWIPAETKHRLSCSGDQPVRVLEVAYGNWQQEDITRYSDDYARPDQGE